MNKNKPKKFKVILYAEGSFKRPEVKLKINGERKEGKIIYQKIYKCDICGKIPEEREKLWLMGNEVWCEECCNKNKELDIKED